MGRYITTTGTAGNTIRTGVTSNFNATVNDRILANSAGGSFTITLPVSTSLLENDTIQIIDVGASTSTNPITIARNGANIQGIADDLYMDLNGSIITLIYTGPTYGWIVSST
jgi:hypothetical protein